MISSHEQDQGKRADLWAIHMADKDSHNKTRINYQEYHVVRKVKKEQEPVGFLKILRNKET